MTFLLKNMHVQDHALDFKCHLSRKKNCSPQLRPGKIIKSQIQLKTPMVNKYQKSITEHLPLEVQA